MRWQKGKVRYISKEVKINFISYRDLNLTYGFNYDTSTFFKEKETHKSHNSNHIERINSKKRALKQGLLLRKIITIHKLRNQNHLFM
jgi:hypothetical protein